MTTAPFSEKPIRMEVISADFWDISPRKMTVEENAGTGRTYFLDKRGRLLAVGKPKEDKPC